MTPFHSTDPSEPSEPDRLRLSVAVVAVAVVDFHELGGPLTLPLALEPVRWPDANRADSGVLAAPPPAATAAAAATTRSPGVAARSDAAAVPVRILASEPYDDECTMPDTLLLRRAAGCADPGAVPNAACAAA